MQKVSFASIDLIIFNAINRYAKKSRILDFFAIACAEYLGYALIVVLVVLAVTGKNWQILVVPVLTGLIARFVIGDIIYILYKRQRPLEVLPVNALIKKPNHPSFPSGHASFFFAISFALFLYSAPLAVIFIVAGCCIGIARIFCGVHWPSDIVAGIAVGLVSFLMIVMLK